MSRPAGRPTKLTSDVVDKIITLRRKGIEYETIALTLHISKCSVFNTCKEHGLVREARLTIDFVNKFWGKWRVPKKHRIRERNGYRVVYKGDPKSLRTMYQWTGRWT